MIYGEFGDEKMDTDQNQRQLVGRSLNKVAAAKNIRYNSSKKRTRNRKSAKTEEINHDEAKKILRAGLKNFAKAEGEAREDSGHGKGAAINGEENNTPRQQGEDDDEEEGRKKEIYAGIPDSV